MGLLMIRLKDLIEVKISMLVPNIDTNHNYNDPDDEYAQNLDSYLEMDGIDWHRESSLELLNPNYIEPSNWNSSSDDPDNPKSMQIAEKDPDTIPPITVLKDGNKYYAIDGIHRTYAFRKIGMMVPALIMSKRMYNSLATSDSQYTNFMLTKYKDAEVPKPVAIK
jgi:hypothetical protein